MGVNFKALSTFKKGGIPSNDGIPSDKDCCHLIMEYRLYSSSDGQVL